MIHPDKIFGRLGNRMFQMAFLYAKTAELGVDWYVQDEYYFKDHANAVRALFSGNIPPRTDKVAIHVRRGDYVGNPFYVDLTQTDYYERAIAMFPKDDFVVFSDDPDWCSEKWGNDKRFTISYGTELDDMNWMASCKAHIIANSSFSWWGAWLCPRYPENKVIAPKAWYADGVERTLLPNHWKRI